MNLGYIALHRSLLDWEWYKDTNTKSLFIHCLLNANFKDKSWQGNIIKRGSFITSLKSLEAELGLTNQKLRTSIGKLKRSKEIAVKTTNKNTTITILNYDSYQQVEQGKQQTTNKRITNKQQTNNKQLTTTNNVNKDNNVNNDNNKNIYKSFNHLKLSIIDFEKLKLDYSETQINEVLENIENYKKNTNYKSLYITAKNWLKKDKEKATSKNQIKGYNSINELEYKEKAKDPNRNKF
ncbi:MAG: hypothetical protein DRI95_00690 [Bacteroidetes bacterium]|nr:MAG: hypothetical protein DRI95_00690 [Bacteroidota bacterium]